MQAQRKLTVLYFKQPSAKKNGDESLVSVARKTDCRTVRRASPVYCTRGADPLISARPQRSGAPAVEGRS